MFENNYEPEANVVAPSMECVNVNVEDGDKVSGGEDNLYNGSDGDHLYSEYNQYASRVDNLFSNEHLFWPDFMHELGGTQLPSQGDGTGTNAQTQKMSDKPNMGSVKEDNQGDNKAKQSNRNLGINYQILTMHYK